MGKRGPKTRATKGVGTMSFLLGVTVPDVPVSGYANALLTAVANVITDILPYAAAITAFAIGVGMLKRWLGHRSASRI